MARIFWASLFALMTASAWAQSSGGFLPNHTLPSAQLNSAFAAKQDFSAALTSLANGVFIINGVTLAQSTSSIGGTFSSGELQFSNNVSGNNVIAVYNASTSGGAGYTARGLDNHEHIAVGLVNPGSTFLSANLNSTPTTTLEVSDYNAVTPPGATVTATISTTTLTTTAVTGTVPTSGATYSGFVVAGSGVTSGTHLTGVCTGTSPNFTCPITPSQTVSSPTSMTVSLPPAYFAIARTGLQNGSWQSGVVSMEIQNAVYGNICTNPVEGKWCWATTGGGATMAMDPVNNYVYVRNLAVNSGTNTAAVTLDLYGSGDNTDIVRFRATANTGKFFVWKTEAGTGVGLAGYWNNGTWGETINPGSYSLSGSGLVLANGELGLGKISASGSAPGGGGGKLALVCGTGAGTAKIIAYAGTSTTPTTVLDNIGSGVTGC